MACPTAHLQHATSTLHTDARPRQLPPPLRLCAAHQFCGLAAAQQGLGHLLLPAGPRLQVPGFQHLHLQVHEMAGAQAQLKTMEDTACAAAA
jgi:hypothetical protein